MPRWGRIWDPIAVWLCFDAGLGASFPLRFGGKIGPTSGQPIDAMVTVTALKRDCWQSFGPTQVPLGDCAAIKAGGVEVVLISNRTQALGLELFRNLDIEPTERRLVVVKSTNHFMAAFGPIAKKRSTSTPMAHSTAITARSATRRCSGRSGRLTRARHPGCSCERRQAASLTWRRGVHRNAAPRLLPAGFGEFAVD